MTQLALDFDAARAAGEDAADACMAKAERVADFDSEGASLIVLRTLRTQGATPGEVLVDIAKAYGFRPHDDRAFGGVFQRLARRKLIRCVGYCERTKGHGTSGGRVWDAVAA